MRIADGNMLMNKSEQSIPRKRNDFSIHLTRTIDNLDEQLKLMGKACNFKKMVYFVRN